MHPHTVRVDPAAVRGVTVCIHRSVRAEIIPFPGRFDPAVGVHGSIRADVVPFAIPMNPFVCRHGTVGLHEVPLVAGFQPDLHDGCSVVVEVVPSAIYLLPAFGILVIGAEEVGLAVFKSMKTIRFYTVIVV